MKNILKITSLLLIILLLTSCIVGCNKNRSGLSYDDVLEYCCEAINTRNKNVISDFIYEDFGLAWNTEMIFDSIDSFDQENIPLENKVSKLKTHYSQEDLDDLQDWIFEDTNTLIEIEEGKEIRMDNDSSIEIFLIKVQNKWYILYFDL